MTELERVLSMAIDAEKEAGKLYTKAASKTTSANNKQVYLWLAREELGHQTLLSALINQYKKGRKFTAQTKVKGGALSEPIECSQLPSFKQTGTESDVYAAEVQIIKSAMKAEAQASSFYKDLAEKTSDIVAKGILKELAQIEKGHLELLTEELKLIREGNDMFLLRRFETPLGE
ncbi:MAG: ferritin family protein [Chloroflexi bacterium]|jgi:rubrerythrin|nr:ferritin family protein [Chloroflexota bacterium]MBT7081233.1 ferritin family protein [Chloroflexota bacterium]